MCFRLLQLAHGSCNGHKKIKIFFSKNVTYFGPELCGNSTFVLGWAISEP